MLCNKHFQGTLLSTLKDAQPTIFFGVPRVYEKMMDSIQQKSEQIKGLKRRLSNWARKKGLKGNLRRQNRYYTWASVTSSRLSWACWSGLFLCPLATLFHEDGRLQRNWFSRELESSWASSEHTYSLLDLHRQGEKFMISSCRWICPLWNSTVSNMYI